jgi:hypothetical protein
MEWSLMSRKSKGGVWRRLSPTLRQKAPVMSKAPKSEQEPNWDSPPDDQLARELTAQLPLPVREGEAPPTSQHITCTSDLKPWTDVKWLANGEEADTTPEIAQGLIEKGFCV